MGTCIECFTYFFVLKGTDLYSLQKKFKAFASARKFENTKEWSQLH